ncbi:carbonic anhydrase [Oceanospirillum multiglobuliferum]|uniref:carbonic anhydrase n=1 Tax=Oceanospirillum multiglobuliferum TaxID=64969 RepID=A0A1T4NBB2_9GAMM|nr:carbonic anhydrase [Oceanospirillum multiglobuliferum]OPX55909.1 carbonic anhydrase [Oceanospirillum multiglobuliferum]SJZ76552.1 carbonic anhydrase [Oceanospirillum multiglobuliferum]
MTENKNITAIEALQRLRAGNKRFTSDVRSLESLLSHTRRTELAEDGQRPCAVILGCSDSRVPAETVFDQGIGDLFVIRVAGNIVAPSQVGSIEFAAEHFGARLVVVLGHSHCGAIDATIDQLENPGKSTSIGIQSIVDRVRPSVETLLSAGLHGCELAHAAVRANVRSSVDKLRHGSALLEHLVEQDGMLIVGAEYNLSSGVVDFFEGLPAGFKDTESI